MTWNPETEKLETALYDFEIRGSRILLRPPKVADEAEWISLRHKNKQFLQPYEPKWAKDALSPAFFQRRIKRVRNDWESDRSYSFLIFRKRTEELPQKMVGGFNINNVCRGAAQFANVGYWLDKDHQGHGYMRAALRMIIYFSHEKLRLHRLNASVLPGNERSQNLLKYVGFDEEGFAEKYIEINGRWQDHILYGLTLPEFVKSEDRRSKER